MWDKTSEGNNHAVELFLFFYFFNKTKISEAGGEKRKTILSNQVQGSWDMEDTMSDSPSA